MSDYIFTKDHVACGCMIGCALCTPGNKDGTSHVCDDECTTAKGDKNDAS